MSEVTAKQMYDEILMIKHDVESVKHQTAWLLRSHAPALSDHWQKVFGLVPGKKRRYHCMRVYLEANGKRSVRQVAQAAGVYEQEAGRLLAEMEHKHHIIELVPQTKNDKIYKKTPADIPLGISARLHAELAKKGTGSVNEDEPSDKH